MKFKSALQQDGTEIPDVMTVADVAAALRISRNTAYELVHSKGFPKVAIGKQYRIPKDKFLNWLDVTASVDVA